MSWLTEPDSEWDAPDEPGYPREPRSRLRLVAMLLGGWLLVSVVVLLILLAVGGHHSNNQAGGGAPGSAVATTGHPSGSATGSALPDGWARQAADQQTNCAAHSYGEVPAFFARTPCVSVQRLLASTSANGRPVVIASNVVTFGSTAQAAQYLNLVNADGTGNVADLLREGVRYPGGPAALPDGSAFASRQDGVRVLVAEAGYVTGASSATDPTLHAIALAAVR